MNFIVTSCNDFPFLIAITLVQSWTNTDLPDLFKGGKVVTVLNPGTPRHFLLYTELNSDINYILAVFSAISWKNHDSDMTHPSITSKVAITSFSL